MTKKWWRTKRSTIVKYEGEGGYCQYHDTKVVEWTADSIILDLDGYDTMTTRNRMNEVAKHEGFDYCVWRERGQTYVAYDTGHKCKQQAVRIAFGGALQETVAIPRGKVDYTKCPDCALAVLRDV